MTPRPRWSRWTLDWVAAGVALGAALLILVLLFWPEPTPPPERPVAEVEAENGDLPARVGEREIRPAAVPELPAGGIAEFERMIAASLGADRPRVRPLTGPLRIRVTDVRLGDPARARPIFRAAGGVALLELPQRSGAPVILRDVVLTAPDLHLVRAAPGGPWNIERVLRRQTAAGQPSAGAGTAVVLRNLVVRRGQLEVLDAGERWALRDFSASLPSATLPPAPGAAISIASLAGTLEVPQQDLPALAVALEDAEVSFSDGATALSASRLRLGETVVTALDARRDAALPGAGIRASGRVAQLRFQDVAFLSPALPSAGTATFAFRVESRPASRFLVQIDDLVASAEDSRVTGSLQALVGGDRPAELRTADLRLDPLQLALVERFAGPLPYGGRLTGRVTTVSGEIAFDVVAMLTSPRVADPFRTDLTGRLASGADGFTLRRLDARLHSVPLLALRELIPALPLTGAVTGTVSLAGPPGSTPLALDVALDLAGGTLTLAGSLDLTGATPAYDFRGRLLAVDLRRLLEPSVPPIRLTAGFTASGRGTDPATARAVISLAGTFDGWHTRPGDGVELDLRLAAGLLAVDSLRIAAGPVRLASAGEWRLIDPSAGSIRYALEVTDLQPLSPYLPGIRDQPATGRLVATGHLSGTSDRPVLAGEAAGREFRWGEWRASDFRLTYLAAFGDDIPRVDLSGAGRGVEAPLVGALAAATLELRLMEPSFSIDFRGDRVAGGRIEVEADGTLTDGPLSEARLRRFLIDLEEERWALVRPTSIRWGGDPLSLFVDDLEIRQVDGVGTVAVAGQLLPAEEASLRAQVRALPVGDLFRLAAPAPDIEGRLWADLDLTGGIDEPVLRSEFRLENAVIGGTAIDEFAGDVRYEAGVLAGRAELLPAAGGRASLEARLPATLAIGLPPRIQIREGAQIHATAVTDSFPLAILEPGIPQFRDLEGLAWGRVTLAGTQSEPQLDGELAVRGGAVHVVPLNQRYREIEGDLVLEGRRVVFRELRGRSDGLITVSGAIEFEQLTDPVADLAVSLDRFRAVGVDDQLDAALWGEIRVRGPLRQPIVTGDVLVDDGSIALPGTGPRTGFGVDGEELAVLAPDPGAPALPGAAAAPGAPWFQGLIVDGLDVRLGRRVWLTSRELRVQLTGDLTIHRGMEDLRIFGELRGERGTFTLQVGPVIRRFDVVSAEVRFFGSPDPDPAINITASRIVYGPAGQEIEILIRVGGTINHPTLALTTGAGSPIPESELLSFILFGQPSFALGEFGGVMGAGVFEGLFAGGLVDFAGMELEHALIEGLGLPLDYVHIRPGYGGLYGLQGATLVLGREVARNIFLTVDAGLAGLFGDVPTRNVFAIRAEWRIDREWRLRVGLEPVDRTRFFNIDLPAPTQAPNQQFTVEIRRRWTY
jgi:hypothetical protein